MLLVVCLLAATSCKNGSPSAAGHTTLRIGFGLGPSARTSGLGILADLLYAEPLIALNAQGKPSGRLAESWEWQDGHRTLRVVLRQGTALHDGRTLDAPLARTFLQHKIDAVQNGDRAGAFDGVQSIDTPDAQTLLIHLRAPDAFLIPEFNNAYLVDPASTDIGTGPFRLVSRDPVQAERFDRHHRGAPAIDRVTIQTYDTQRAAWAALMRNEVDAVQEVNRESIEFMATSTDIKTFSSLRPYYWALSLNLKHPQLRRPEVRRTLNKAVNRDEIISRVMRGYGTPAVDPVWPLFWAYPSLPKHHEFQPAVAKVEMQEHLRGRPGLKFRCLFYGEDPQFERMALLLQRQLNEVGVQLELQPATLKEMMLKMQSGDFDSMLLLFASGRALDWTYRFWHSPLAGQQSLQTTSYTGADSALDDLRVAFTEPEVREGVTRLRQTFYEDPPAVFIAWQQVTRAVSARFDLSEADEQDAFANIWQWKPAARRP